VVTVVVLVDVMLRVPVPLPALTVEPPPTWATAEELTTDSAIAASTGLRALPSMCVPAVLTELTVALAFAAIATFPPAPLTAIVVDGPSTVTEALGSRSAIAVAAPNALRAPPRGLLFV